MSESMISMDVSILITFLARLLLVLLFLPFSALDKVFNFRSAVAQASEATSNQALAKTLILVGLGVEVFMSLGVLTGIADRFAAFVLAGYCIITALLWKQFWKQPDFSLRGKSAGREVFWDFLKNLAVAGGFLMIAIGPNASSVWQFIHAPFSSTYPYSTLRVGF
jgi:putative oxidoreductase